MKGIETIRRENMINYPWEYLPMNLPRKDATEKLLQEHGHDIHILLLRIVYDAQLEVFHHFGKGEEEFHKWKRRGSEDE